MPASMLVPLQSRARVALARHGLLLLTLLLAVPAWAADTWMAFGNAGSMPASLHGVSAIGTSLQTTVAVKRDGTVVAWGNGNSGQTAIPAGLRGVVSVAPGAAHMVALTSNGQVITWGDNSSGQCTIPGGLSDVIAVAAGELHSVALKSDGTVVAWGSNSSGQATVPVGLTGVTAIAAGDAFTMALKSDGTVVAWGDNGFGQTTIPSGLSGVTAIAVGACHAVALKSEGTVVAWGRNYSGESTVPLGLAGITGIAAGDLHTMALRSDGTVVAWGNDGVGQCTVPAGLGGVTALAARGFHSVALYGDGTVIAWGAYGASQNTVSADFTEMALVASGTPGLAAVRSDGTVVTWGDNPQNRSQPPAGLSDVTALAMGSRHFVARKNDGTVVAWGDDSAGQATVPSGLAGVTNVAAGGNFSLALKSDGTVVAWGDDSYDQTEVPVGLTDVVAIAAGDYHGLALKSDGTVVAWGDNQYGERTFPSGLTAVSAIAAAGLHTLLLQTDGTVVAIGSNIYGQVSVPVGLSGVTAIAAGSYHSLALKSDGTVVAWGDQTFGETHVPAGLSGAVAISAGGTQSWARVPARPANAITITDASVAWDGAPHTVAISTANGRTPTSTTYNGSFTPPTAAGTYTVVAEADYFDSYGIATGTLTITGSGTPQTITGFTAFGSHTYGDSTFSISGVTGGASGNPVVFTSGNTAVATVSGSTITITGAGSVVITATQAGDSTHDAAAPVARTLTVGKAPLLVAARPAHRVFGTANPAFNGILSGVVGTDVLSATYASSATTATTAGIYDATTAEAITPTLVDPGNRLGNYALTVDKGALDIEASEQIWVPLGDAGRVPRSLHGVKAVAGGNYYSAALRADGTVVAWGANLQLQSTVPSGLGGVTAIAGGYTHMLALKADGTVVAWGDNYQGETMVPSGLTDVRAIAAGDSFSLALKNDGTVVAWGGNTSDRATVPSGLNGVTAIAAGIRHALAVKSDGTVVAWGDNFYGQSSVPSGLSGVVAVAAGYGHSLALKDDGTVVAWGDNGFGQATVPVGLTNVVAISTFDFHCLALKDDGTVVAWGMDLGGMARVPDDLSDPIAIATAAFHNLVVTSDGEITTWGSAYWDPLIAPTGVAQAEKITATDSLRFAVQSDGTVLGWGDDLSGKTSTAKTLTNVIDTAACSNFAMALQSDGTVVTWGNDTTGQSEVVVQYPGVIGIAASHYHALALQSEGTLLAWGSNTAGESESPSGLTGVIAIAVGTNFSLALQGDGHVVAWGDNSHGQTAIPTSLSEVTAIAVGDAHSLALKSDGTVAAWGLDDSGQTDVPSGLSHVIAIAAGDNHSVALRDDGSVVVWGDNAFGETTIPTGLSGVSRITAGGTQTWVHVTARLPNTVTITTASVAWDGAPHTVAISTANGRAPTSTTYNGSFTPPSDVGTYTVVTEADYWDSYGTATGTLTITGSTPQTISGFTAFASRTYGDAAFTLSGVTGGTSGNPVVFASGNTAVATVSGTTVTITGAGSAVITATQAGDSTHDAATPVARTLTVTKAPLSVTAADASRHYGAANPSFSGALVGVIGSDAISATYASTASATTPVGTYGPATAEAIVPNLVDPGGRLGNYALTVTNGTLAITGSVSQTITGFTGFASRTYGDAAFTISGVSGGASGNPVVFASGNAAVATISGSTVTITGAGSAVITATQTGDASYAAAAPVTRTLTVAKASLSVTAADASRLYGAANPSFTGALVGVVGSDAISATYASAATATTPVGTYGPATAEAIIPTLVDPGSRLGNYVLTVTNGTLSVTGTMPQAIAGFAAFGSRTYGDAAFTISGVIGGTSGNPVVFTSGNTAVATVSGTTVTITGAGSAVITATQAGDATHDAATPVTRTLTVAKAPLSVTAADVSRIFGAANPSFTGALIGVIDGDAISATYASAATATTLVGTYGPATAEAIVPTLVDPGSRLGNYVLTVTNGTLAITGTMPQVITGFVAFDNHTYGDAALTISGVAAGGSGNPVVFTSDNTAVATVSGSIVIITGAGSAVITATQAGDADYDAATPVTRTLIVAKAPLSVTAADASRTFGATNPSFSGALVGVVGSDAISATYASTASTTTPVGTYGPATAEAITPTLVDPGGRLSNYVLTVTNGTLAITGTMPQTITGFVAFDNHTYGDAALTISGVAGGDSGNPVVFASGNAAVATVSGTTVTITGAGSAVITATQAGDADYAAATPVTQTLIVRKASLSVTADDASRLYGAVNPGFTGALLGVVGSDAISAIYGSTASAITPVGTYAPTTVEAITPTLVDPGGRLGNYVLTVTNGTLTIDSAAQTITGFAALSSHTYGDAAFPISGVTGGDSSNPVVFVSGNTAVATVSGSTVTITGAGSAVITATQASDGNYTAAAPVTRTLTVAKAPLSVTAADASRIYGTANPGFTGSLVGVIGSDAISATYASAATAATPVGIYGPATGEAIAPTLVDTDGRLDNYTLTVTNGTLTVGAASLTITADNQAMVAGFALPTLTWSASGLRPGDTIAVISGTPALTTTATSMSPAGSYPIHTSVAGVTVGNYTVTASDGLLTVNASPIPIDPNENNSSASCGSGSGLAALLVGALFAMLRVRTGTRRP